MAIFKAIYHLEMLGHTNTIWIDYPNNRKSSEDAYIDIISSFKPVKAQVRLLGEQDYIVCDILMVTDRWTVWSGLKHGRTKKIFYFVQDYEPYFSGRGSETIISDATYDLNIFAICSSRGYRR